LLLSRADLFANCYQVALPGMPRQGQIADSVRLRMAFSQEVACAQNMRF
jgi:hypothetical protein